MNILECTIKMKKETRAHYGRLAEAVVEPELKRLFAMLAAAEDRHVVDLITVQKEMQAAGVEETGSFAESVCVYSPKIDPANIAQALSHDPDAYRHVVQDEEDTIELFDQVGNETENAALKRICQLQAAKEREHLAILENIYAFVEEPRTYLEWGEFSNLKSL